jgi:DNA-binding PadR family transcriptional regulator
LAQRKAYPYEIKAAIETMSHSTIKADENSIYCSLNRLAEAGIVGSELLPSETGPSRRSFFLAELGHSLLTRFITRNILVYEQPDLSDIFYPV